MSVRLPAPAPAGLKKSILATCVAFEALPSAISVDQLPPLTTSGKTTAPAAPVELVVGTGEVLTVTGNENVGVGVGVEGTPIPNPACGLGGFVAGVGAIGAPRLNPVREVLEDVGVRGCVATETGVDKLVIGIDVKKSP